MNNLIDQESQENDLYNASIKLSLDKDEAYIIITAPETEGKEICEEQIHDFLLENNIVFGIDTEQIKQICLEKKYDVEVLIASGQPPENGQDGWIEYYFDKDNFGHAKEKPDGSLDFKDLGLIINVAKDQKLCTIHMHTSGINGTNVLGGSILAKKGRPIKSPLGTNTYLSEDGKVLFSSIVGQVIYKAGTVSVSELFILKGNVDNGIGNIVFDGTVIINGDILSGFSVCALGDVEVYGMVEAASVKSGGNIILHNGMNGVGKGTLEAKGTIKATYIENATVISKGDIYVETLLNCIVKCEANLELSSKKGLIAGGSCIVAKNIISHTIGHPSHIKTYVAVGVSSNLSEEITATKNLITSIEKEVIQLTHIINYLEPLFLANTISLEKQNTLKSARLSKMLKLSQKNDAEKNLEKINQKLLLIKESAIVCKGKIYAGTKIEINGRCLTITDEIVNSRLYLCENEIIITFAV